MNNRNETPVISMEKAGMKINGDWKLKDISWTVGIGEKWGLIGPNGSGKTLMLQMIQGYRRQSCGKIFRFGCEQTDLREFRKRTGYVSASMKTLIPACDTVMDTVISGFESTLGNYWTNSEKQSREALKLISRAGLGDKDQRRFSTLSEGEKSRAMFARVLAGKPEMVIFDEPCEGLDIPGRESVLSTLSELILQYPELPVIYVSHHADEIISEIGKVLMLKDGRILHQGDRVKMMDENLFSELFGVNIRLIESAGRYFSVVEGA